MARGYFLNQSMKDTLPMQMAGFFIADRICAMEKPDRVTIVGCLKCLKFTQSIEHKTN